MMGDNAELYIKKALAMGADHAVRFTPEDLSFDPRTLLKCMYGCEDWGKNPTCPSRPGSLRPWEYEPILRRYRWGIIIHAHDKKATQDISFEIERQAYLDGHYFAFSFSDCALCRECAGMSGKDCAFAKKARPAFHSVGIDVFKTARSFGLPIETLRDESQQQNWYAAVFVE
jgi:predicted metal-binding protein